MFNATTLKKSYSNESGAVQSRFVTVAYMSTTDIKSVFTRLCSVINNLYWKHTASARCILRVMHAIGQCVECR